MAKELAGQRGLLFTSSTPFIVTDWFASFTKPDYARTGNIAPSTIIIPAGPVMIDDTPAAHSLEPQLRKLGLSTKLNRGVPTLDVEHTLCKEGQELNSNQVNLLKLFNKPMATVSLVSLFQRLLLIGNGRRPTVPSKTYHLPEYINWRNHSSGRCTT